MKIIKVLFLFTLVLCMVEAGCNSKKQGKEAVSVQTADTTFKLKLDSKDETIKGFQGSFEKEVYLKLDKVYSGPLYLDDKKQDVFYRVLEIPEEENVMLYAENISIGEEGGSYKLIKRTRVTDEGGALPKYGINQIDALKFIDSVTVVIYYDQEKFTINLRENKKVL